MMRVKVGDQWFEAKIGQPIMVELSAGDKRNVANMHPDATRYAIFDDGDGLSSEAKLAWMNAGALQGQPCPSATGDHSNALHRDDAKG